MKKLFVLGALLGASVWLMMGAVIYPPSGGGTIIVTNVFSQTLYSSNVYATNITVNTITNNIAYITNLYNSNIFATNITVNTITNNNAYITNLYSITQLTGNKASINNIYVNDGSITNGLYFYTNTWANAPTGTLDLRITDQYVQTYVPMSITGFTSKSNNVSESVVMTITNAASTNITVYLPAGFALDTRASSLTVSNASFGILSIRYHPVGLTNGIYKQW